MARRTKGYPFAFQPPGHLAWKHQGLNQEVLNGYKAQRFELSYDKIWSELSQGDRRIAYGMALSPTPSIAAIRSTLGIKPNQLSPYRRLMNKGIADDSERPILRFALPYFAEYALERYGGEGLDE